MRHLAALLAALLLTACGSGQGQAQSTPPSAPPPTADPAPGPTTPAPTSTRSPGEGGDDDEGTIGGATEVTAYFARVDDSGAWVEPVSAPLDEPTVAVAAASYELLLSGDPADPGLSSATGPGVDLLGVDIDGDTLTVDLSGALRDNRSGSAGELALAQQLAHTGAQFDGVARVQLRVDGAEVSDLWGHLDWSEAVEPDPFALSPITFDSHGWGEQVPAGEVAVGGEANTFEATVQLRLLGPDGDVIDETFTTATSGSGQRGTWEHTFFLEGAATWTIEASEPDPSDGEGRPPFTTSLELRSA